MKHYDVIIIGAGTAGLTARREVEKVTKNYIIVDDGPMGTTCARVGCMPSKVLIQVANDFYRRKSFDEMGINGADGVTIDSKKVMAHVRKLRDRFVRGVMSSMSEWEDKLVRKRAVFIDSKTLDLDGEKVTADKIILATGSRPVLPEAWSEYSDLIMDTDKFFELEALPKKVVVIGLGVIGIEIGQALNRLGVEVIGITVGKEIGGITNPKIQSYVADKFSQEMKIHFNGADLIGRTDDGKLIVKADDEIYEVDMAFVSVGRRANIDKIGIEKLNVKLNKIGIPEINHSTMKLIEAPHILIPGDVNGDRPILHEAADEGVIAGHNAVNEEVCFKRRVSLGVTFSDPNLAFVGKRWKQLVEEKAEFVIGEVSFEGQGRSIVKLKEQGILQIYVEKSTGELLGSEIHAPDGEHLAHMIAWGISTKMTVFEALKMPFYHPVIEEGVRTALRSAAKQISPEKFGQELFRCSDAPIR